MSKLESSVIPRMRIF